MSGARSQRTDDETLEVATEITPLAEDDADLRELQLAAIVRLLQRGLQLRQSEGASGR